MKETLIGADYEGPKRPKPEEVIGNIRGIFFGEIATHSVELPTYYDALHRVAEVKKKEHSVILAQDQFEQDGTDISKRTLRRTEIIFQAEILDAKRQGDEDPIYMGAFNRLRVIANSLDEAYAGQHLSNPVKQTANQLNSLHMELGEIVPSVLGED